MAYIDLIQSQGAQYYCSFNNTLTPEINSGTQSLSSGSARTFTAKAPTAMGTTHSVNLSKYATTPQMPEIYGLVGQQPRDFGAAFPSTGQTLSFWLYFDYPEGTTTMPSGFYLFNKTRASSTEIIQLFGGTLNDNINNSDRKINWSSGVSIVSDAQNTSSLPAINGGFKISKGKWHHFAFVYSYNQTGSSGGFADGYFERALYYDGTLQHHVIDGYTYNGWSDGGWGHGTTYPTQLLGTLNAVPANTTTDVHIAGLAIFKKTLTKQEIQEQAMYGKSNSDYNSVVLSKNPVYFTNLNNTNKTIAPTIYGPKSTWQIFKDDADCIVVNEASKFDKSWKFKHSNLGFSDGNNFNAVLDTTTLTELKDLFASGEFTFEWWQKTGYASLPLNPRGVFTLGSSSTTQNGYLQVTLASDGRFTMSVPNRTGATTYSNTTSSIGGTYVATDDATWANVQHSMGNKRYRFADGNWHHCAVKISRTNVGSNVIRFTAFIDGKIAVQNLTNTFGWITPDNILNQIILNNSTSSSAATNLDVWLDNFAVYNYALSDDEIIDNYINGYIYQAPPTGAVRYYDGTTWQLSAGAKTWNGSAWVDWVKKYWNGTAWIDLP